MTKAPTETTEAETPAKSLATSLFDAVDGPTLRPGLRMSPPRSIPGHPAPTKVPVPVHKVPQPGDVLADCLVDADMVGESHFFHAEVLSTGETLVAPVAGQPDGSIVADLEIHRDGEVLRKFTLRGPRSVGQELQATILKASDRLVLRLMQPIVNGEVFGSITPPWIAPTEDEAINPEIQASDSERSLTAS